MIEMLKNAYFLPQLSEFKTAVIGDVFVINRNAPALGFFQQINTANESGLPAPEKPIMPNISPCRIPNKRL